MQINVVAGLTIDVVTGLTIGVVTGLALDVVTGLTIDVVTGLTIDVVTGLTIHIATEQILKRPLNPMIELEAFMFDHSDTMNLATPSTTCPSYAGCPAGSPRSSRSEHPSV